MSGLILTITDAGRAALVNAAHLGTLPVLMSEVGISTTAITPLPTATSLPGEIKRLTTFAGDVVADDTIHVTVRDESADVYTVRSFGLYLADGTLFALYGQATPIMEKSAQAMLLLVLDVIFADIDAAKLTFGDTSFLNPPATTERQGVVELATPGEAVAGTDQTRAVTPEGVGAALTDLLETVFAGAVGQSGYQRLPNGLILQWGRFLREAVPAGGLVRNDYTFPIAFPTEALHMDCSMRSSTIGVYATRLETWPISPTQFRAEFSNQHPADPTDVTFSIWALGW